MQAILWVKIPLFNPSIEIISNNIACNCHLFIYVTFSIAIYFSIIHRSRAHMQAFLLGTFPKLPSHVVYTSPASLRNTRLPSDVILQPDFSQSGQCTIVILIFIFLIVNEVEYLFLYLLLSTISELNSQLFPTWVPGYAILMQAEPDHFLVDLVLISLWWWW